MKLPTEQAIFQNAWVVDDVEATARNWVETFNLGPFFMAEYRPEDLSDVLYKGKPGTMNMLLAIAQAGPIQIELIQPLGDEENAYRDTVKKGQNGFHHVCVWSSDLDADLAFYENKGCEINTVGKVVATGARFAYVDSHSELSCMLEILEHNDEIKEMFKMIADTCANWDGKDPIRSFE